jgi:hypothetical protein
MADIGKAVASQLANIEKKTGKSLAQLVAAVRGSGRSKHGEIRTWLKETLGLGHGDANAIAHLALRAEEANAAGSGAGSIEEALAGIYSGKKAHLRTIHDALMTAIARFGEFEIAPKKGYVSLRRKKQFAMLGPKTNERFELGINLREKVDDPRVKALPPGGMCQYVVPLTAAAEVDARLIAVVRRAFDAAG